MPRVIEERWTGIGYTVESENIQIAGPDGQPLFDAHGLPRTEEHTTLVLIVPLPDGQRVIRVPFNREAKTELIRQLTGGIVVPSNGHTP